MTSIEPAPKVIELYNKLVGMPFSAAAELRSLEWQLRLERRRQVRDPEIAIALIQALIMQGNADEVRELADFVWEVRYKLKALPKLTFVRQLCAIGEFERAWQLGFEDNADKLPKSNSLMASLLRIGVGRGNLALIRQAHQYFSKGIDAVSSFEKALEAAGLTSHFPVHQGTILKAMSGRFTDFVGNLCPCEEGGFELINEIYVRDDRSERRSAERAIDDALAAYYSSAGLDPYVYVPLITTQVLDIMAHPKSVLD